jgi:hypothetical protein
MTILLKKILEKAKRFFQMPIFKQYAIADGIYRILFNVKWGLRQEIPKIALAQQEFDFVMEI